MGIFCRKSVGDLACQTVMCTFTKLNCKLANTCRTHLLHELLLEEERGGGGQGQQRHGLRRRLALTSVVVVDDRRLTGVRRLDEHRRRVGACGRCECARTVGRR